MPESCPNRPVQVDASPELYPRLPSLQGRGRSGQGKGVDVQACDGMRCKDTQRKVLLLLLCWCCFMLNFAIAVAGHPHLWQRQ